MEPGWHRGQTATGPLDIGRGAVLPSPELPRLRVRGAIAAPTSAPATPAGGAWKLARTLSTARPGRAAGGGCISSSPPTRARRAQTGLGTAGDHGLTQTSLVQGETL